MSSDSLRVWQHSPERFFESGFEEIARTRMQGLPVLNPKLRVKALGFERLGNDWMGCVVTPWSILVVLACGNRATWEAVPVTHKRVVTLPSGEYEFMGMNDPVLGEYQMCSLISPVTDLPDQQTAEAVAHQALALMRRVDGVPDEDEQGTALVPDPYVDPNAEPVRKSRRAFLTGRAR